MNIFRKLLIAFVMLSLVGCEDELTLTPEDSISPELFFTSEEDLKLWTNSFYTQMDNANSQAAQNADDHIDYSLGAIMEGQRDASNESGWNWSMLRRINFYLQNSSQADDLPVKAHYDGIAYFMRAFFYFEKVQRYGDVPWYNQVLESVDEKLLFKERDDRQMVMDSVMADLDKAIEMLTIEKSKTRVTKWTALALKSRAALYEGTFRKYHSINGGEGYLEQSAEAAREFINSSGYGLYNVGNEPYRDLFVSEEAQTKEVILARVYSPNTNLMHSVQFNISNMNQGFTKRYMNHYLMADGTRFTEQEGWETMTFSEETQNRDPRLAQTVITPGYIQKGTSEASTNKLSALTGYSSIKFVAEPAFDGANKGIFDWPLFRTAEVYLNYAEAKAELGTLLQEDLDISINKIRERVNMPPLDLVSANATPDALLLDYYPNVSKSGNTGVILEIRRERTIELTMEGFRQWDLMRWKEGENFSGPYYGVYFPGPGEYDMDNDGITDLILYIDEKQTADGAISLKIGTDVKLSKGNSGYIEVYSTNILNWQEERDYLWPIPASERVLSGGVLSQNPGWTDSTGF